MEQFVQMKQKKKQNNKKPLSMGIPSGQSHWLHWQKINFQNTKLMMVDLSITKHHVFDPKEKHLPTT